MPSSISAGMLAMLTGRIAIVGMAMATITTPVESFVRANSKIGRNDPWPCGTGKRHKKCYLA